MMLEDKQTYTTRNNTYMIYYKYEASKYHARTIISDIEVTTIINTKTNVELRLSLVEAIACEELSKIYDILLHEE